jgi:MoaA/NifB/PqqE/SkfB family radical SAM enzyme
MRAHPTSRRFPVHDFAELGMMIQISSNGSRLDQSRALDILTRRRPYRLTLSIYGATEATYDGMTRRRGSFRRFMRGLDAAYEAELSMRINIVVSSRNVHEIGQMKAIADRYGIESFEYCNISPTIHGSAQVLPVQRQPVLTAISSGTRPARRVPDGFDVKEPRGTAHRRGRPARAA